MDVGVNQQCLLCLSLCCNYKLWFLFCNGISHAGAGCVFRLPAGACWINPHQPTDSLPLLFGSGSEHLSQAANQFNQSSFQPDINYLMNSIRICIQAETGSESAQDLFSSLVPPSLSILRISIFFSNMCRDLSWLIICGTCNCFGWIIPKKLVA